MPWIRNTWFPLSLTGVYSGANRLADRFSARLDMACGQRLAEPIAVIAAWRIAHIKP
jgi:hypothetical protein